MENSGGKTISILEEIIFEIFSWLPVKSLMRFKCVTKFCNSLVSESDFMDIHRCRSITRPGGTKFFLHEWKSGFYTAEQIEDGKDSASLFQTERFIELYDHGPKHSQLDYVNGLFFIRGSMRPAAIFNPSSREVRYLPKINELCPCNYSLGFEPEEKKFKVLTSAMGVRERYFKHWVFTLGIDESWRETQSISTYTHYCMPGVCISGVIYQSVISDNKDAIAAFDVKSEKLEIIALWNASESLYYYELIEVKGKLAVIDYKRWLSGYIDLWILEQTPRKEWERHTIGVPLIWNDIKPRFASSSMGRDGEIVFIMYLKSDACLCYDVTKKSWRELKIKGLPKENYIKDIYSYVESLVPVG